MEIKKSRWRNGRKSVVANLGAARLEGVAFELAQIVAVDRVDQVEHDEPPEEEDNVQKAGFKIFSSHILNSPITLLESVI